MKMKYTVIFLLCVLVLAASEYLFLLELSSQQRLFVLLSTTIVAIASVIAIFTCYKHLRKDA
jgi:heme/copper-type cytochrome/quinol oxidase subunit 1